MLLTHPLDSITFNREAMVIYNYSLSEFKQLNSYLEERIVLLRIPH